jgi:hypothetical protein
MKFWHARIRRGRRKARRLRLLPQLEGLRQKWKPRMWGSLRREISKVYRSESRKSEF